METGKPHLRVESPTQSLGLALPIFEPSLEAAPACLHYLASLRRATKNLYYGNTTTCTFFVGSAVLPVSLVSLP